jgi:hypothetical protein
MAANLNAEQIFSAFAAAAKNPLHREQAWNYTHGTAVVGSSPKHFPGELAHAAGWLPVIPQENHAPIAASHGMIGSFCCGFMRRAVDQARKGVHGPLRH